MVFDLEILRNIYKWDLILFFSSHRINGENKISNENHMTEINHFNFFALYSCDVAMIGQLRWIAHMSRELVDANSFI
jgi:hypothetical protein